MPPRVIVNAIIASLRYVKSFYHTESSILRPSLDSTPYLIISMSFPGP